jgi:cytoskeleton protein RodZ
MVEFETEQESVSVGTILREGREERNISITDIAHQLHLDSKIIRALEDDDYDYLPDPIYVRGYIRNYCKLLGKEPEEILDQFMKNSGGKDPEIIPEIKHHSQTSSSDKPVKAFTYLISLALVILLIAWWQRDELLIEDIDTVEVGAPDPDEVTILPDEPVETVENTIEDEVETNESIDAQPFLQTDDELSFESNEEQVIDNISTNSTSPAFSNANAAESPFIQPEPEEYVASTGPDTLVLTVNSDSWIEIYDVNSQRVYFDLGRRGDRLTLYGTAPFEILLGFAQGVSIEFNGEPIEQAPFTRSGVARFTLGE